MRCVKNLNKSNRKPNLRKYALIPILLAVLLPTGCVRPPRATLPAVSAKSLLQTLQDQSDRFRSLQGTAVLRVNRGGERHSAKQVLLVQRPDLFRAEVLSPFGQPVATVAACDGRLTAFVPGEGRYYVGTASAENLYRLAGLPLKVPELLRYVFYDAPLLPRGDNKVSIEDGLYRLDRSASDGRREQLFFDGSGRLRKVSLFAGETPLLQAEYDELREEDGLPLELSLALPSVDMRIELQWRSVRANGDIPRDRFMLSPPDGAEVMALP